ncbi:uncharacterized protein TA14630 [Theileria annulata]|uniref:Breast carcinoma amplified sequence 2 (BCAS2) n=1 Tax=Theileria annulata TaxID=5874 RepID=Q4UF54_THEAN|nr:uncharacterized protein TA14630 [Theileria annulata]CAI74285.1 hypothetical protein, conserved [Theileria annulata]|eukprot:XP_952017.1 hypothetical protein, conserved [Theileria annulata]
MNDKLIKDQLYKNNKNYDLVDSLPFVDTVSVELAPKVNDLIADEMKLILEERNCSESELLANYLSDFTHKIVENRNILNDGDGMDFTKYDGLGDDKDLKAKMNHLKMLMEYSQDSLINLELMDRYKESCWLNYLDSLTLLKLRLEKEKNKLDGMLEEVNKRRKLSQIETANKLRSLYQNTQDYNHKNVELLTAIEQLQKNKHVNYDDP